MFALRLEECDIAIEPTHDPLRKTIFEWAVCLFQDSQLDSKVQATLTRHFERVYQAMGGSDVDDMFVDYSYDWCNMAKEVGMDAKVLHGIWVGAMEEVKCDINKEMQCN